ncbi:hypothetical protein AHX56_24815 [Salmonella enterica subsp. enterica]|nr:hypothetical protein [Salmonella enterica subsp. enterica]EBP9900628.1 hypothetical protein [Salmonella enterica]
MRRSCIGAVFLSPVPRIKRDIGTPHGYRGHPGGRRYDVRSLLPGACTPRPVTGQADRGIPQPSVSRRQGYAAKAA